MQENFGIGPEQVDALYQYAKCIYECGSYDAAGELLHQYCTYSLDPLKLLSAMWGKLASEILDCNVRPNLNVVLCEHGDLHHMS
jgi:translation initiation factor 3 subunit E